MQKVILLTGTIIGGLSVIIGAFGAHALKSTLEQSGRLETFETAVKYQFYHAFALLILGLLMFRINHMALQYSGYAFFTGIILFSGSLYLLCLTGISKFAIITPFGGVAFIAGWIFLFLGIYKTL